jgi:hypothetical protein
VDCFEKILRTVVATSTYLVEKWNTYKILVGKSEVKRLLDDLDVGGRIISRWILERKDGV